MLLQPLETLDDGFYHPASEDELIALVKKAYAEGLQVRVRGSVHSVAHAIYTDGSSEVPNQVGVEKPPVTGNINIMLDQYFGFEVVDPERRLVEVKAGTHLGMDPSDPTGTSTQENSLLWRLWKEHGWAIDNTGGISHQTVSGFTAMGSSGGSLIYSDSDNLHGFRVIDGTGQVYEVNRDDNPDEFFAMSPSLGLLGIVSTITWRCVPTFNIAGQEAITTYEECAIDLFGDSPAKPSLQEFLKSVEYTRFDWWPQPGCERIVLWQAQRIPPQPGFRPRRYEQFTQYPELAEAAICLFLFIIGNLDDVSRIKVLPRRVLGQLPRLIKLMFRDLPAEPAELAMPLNDAAETGLDEFINVLGRQASSLKPLLPEIFPRVLNLFMPLDSEAKGMRKGEPQSFHDWAWQGLPMDNQAIDQLVATEFTEMWIPIQYSQKVMRRFRKYFEDGNDAMGTFARTGTYCWEVYGAKPSQFWLNASYTDGQDAWKDGVVRVDIFWFTYNRGDPAACFYPQFWKLLREENIPFRLHWGKFQPIIPKGDPEGWVEFFRKQYPRWDDFLALRARRDPNNLFLTDYWRSLLGLWDAPSPRPLAARS